MYTVLHVPQSMSKLIGRRVLPFSPCIRLYATGKAPATHYDTLEVPHNASQTQIKSAYYRLTLKFHPDKNKTDFAKKRFQDISDAYEVLSSNDSRQVYDRSIMIKRDPITAAKQSIERSAGGENSASKSAADFDARSRQHYKESLAKTIHVRKDHEFLTKSQRGYYNTREESTSWSRFFTIVVVPLLFLALIFRKPDYDVPEKPVQRKDKQ